MMPRNVSTDKKTSKFRRQKNLFQISRHKTCRNKADWFKIIRFKSFCSKTECIFYTQDFPAKQRGGRRGPETVRLRQGAL